MNTPRDWAALQRAADVLQIRTGVRSAGGVLLFCGVSLVYGTLAFQPDPVLRGIGLVLLVAGAWEAAAPHPAAYAVNAVIVAFFGVRYVVMSMTSWREFVSSGSWVLIGLLLVLWGVRLVGTFLRLRSAPGTPASEDTLNEARQLIVSASAGRVNDDPERIEWWALHSPLFPVRARLHAGGAVCRMGPGLEARFVARPQFRVERRGAARVAGLLEVRVRLGDEQWNATMSLQSYERWQHWWAAAGSRAA